MPRWRVSFALLYLVGSASSALAQRPDDFLRTFGTIAQSATVQATQAAWAKLPSEEAACVNDALYQQGGSVEALIQRGVMPSDPRLANERSNCQKQSERQELQNGLAVSSPLPNATTRNHGWTSNQSLRFNVLPTDTSVSLGANISSTDEKWLPSLSAEQKLFGGPFSVTGSVSETPTGETSKSLTAGFKRQW